MHFVVLLSLHAKTASSVAPKRCGSVCCRVLLRYFRVQKKNDTTVRVIEGMPDSSRLIATSAIVAIVNSSPLTRVGSTLKPFTRDQARRFERTRARFSPKAETRFSARACIIQENRGPTPQLASPRNAKIAFEARSNVPSADRRGQGFE